MKDAINSDKKNDDDFFEVGIKIELNHFKDYQKFIVIDLDKSLPTVIRKINTILCLNLNFT
jgi:hypothetical protein